MRAASRHLFFGRTFRRYFLSYIIVLMLLLGINMFYYARSYNLLKDESLRANGLQASRFASVVENEISNTMNTTYKMENSYYFTYALNEDNRAGNMNRYPLQKLREQLALSKSNNTLDFFIYFAKHDLIVSDQNATATSPLYYSGYYASPTSSYADFLSLIHSNEYVRCGVVNSSGQPCLVITHTLPTNTRLNAHATAVSILRPSALSGFMETGVTQQGAVAVYNADGRLLVASDASIAPELLPDMALDGKACVTENGGTSYYLSVIRSDNIPAFYVSIVNAAVFAEKTEQLRRTQYTILAVIIIIGLLVAFLLARRNIRPIADTVRAVADQTQIQWKPAAEDEFSYLKNTVENTIQEKTLFQETLDRKVGSLKQSFLYEAVHGAIPEKADVRKVFTANRLPTVSDRFAVLILRAGADGGAPDALETLITHLVYQYDCICHPLYINQPDITIILNLPVSAAETLPVQIATALFAQLMSRMLLSVSDAYTGGAGLCIAFQQARALMEYGIVYGVSRVLTPDLAVSDAAFHYNAKFPAIAENLISAAIRTETLPPEAVRSLGAELQRSYVDDPMLSPAAARCFIYDTGNIVSGVLTALLPAPNIASIWAENPSVFATLTVPEFLAKFSACLTAARVLYAKKTNTDEDIADRVDAYLAHNFSDANLNLAALEPVFGLSGNYLSEKYKAKRGVSIPERIAALRMARTCELLVTTNLSLEVICEDVGIQTSSTLIRAFKKNTGVTPGTYRQLYTKKSTPV